MSEHFYWLPDTFDPVLPFIQWKKSLTVDCGNHPGPVGYRGYRQAPFGQANRETQDLTMWQSGDHSLELLPSVDAYPAHDALMRRRRFPYKERYAHQIDAPTSGRLLAMSHGQVTRENKLYLLAPSG